MYIDLFSSFIMFMWIFYMFINNKTKKLWQYSVNKYRVQFFQMGSSSSIIFNNFKIDSEFFFIKPPPPNQYSKMEDMDSSHVPRTFL